MIQQIIVIIIGIAVFGLTGWRIYKLFTQKNAGNSRCAGCDVDCALRNLNPDKCEGEDGVVK
ncbi:FeoB-associated Cys-rich membrane protein [Paludibacter sp. 221]|uniref:FeoB-associated Cys-rich membrane protein n=1 Tax=Paludibacter sp. 221 TaxID=2302939 RepID=UPI0013D2FB30|nr:FeoB-associated Cys-rich membrane protein [Paludibacter sp. 221]NDV45982.1 FeoB-associated Cys-rich membrane protein [Paludibacter sp. 221]